MSLAVNIALIVIALSHLLLILFLILLFVQVRRLAASAKEFLEKAQVELLPSLSNLRASSVHLKDASVQASAGVSKLVAVFAAIGEGAETLRRVNSILRALMPSTAIGAASFVVGVKTGLGVLVNHLLRRRKRR